MLITIVAGIFVLGVVILVHEFGHFIVAKLSGIFVETFSIGFGKKVLRKRVGETEYALSVLPFGGYVKFAGEDMEDGDKENAAEKATEKIAGFEVPPERFFRNKRVLIRSAVLFAGPAMNYLLAIFIYTGVYFTSGLQIIPSTTIGQITAGSPADSCGIQSGDEILAVNGSEVKSWGEFIDAVIVDVEQAKTLSILRNGSQIENEFWGRIVDNRIQLGLRPHIAATIGKVKRDAPAARAGMERGAVITAINDTLVSSYYDLERIIHSNPGNPLVIEWSHRGATRVDTLVPEAKKVLKEGTQTEMEIVGQIGIGPYYEKKPVGFISSIEMGLTATASMTGEILSFLKLLFTGKAGIDSLGGPILITQMAGDMARWGFNYLLYFLAFFSINLCIFNLLPILPFDGGHLSLFAFEGISRRQVNRRVREILTQAGFGLIILLMIFVVIVDISRCAGSSPGLF
ncbi:MAG: RIP metalloprotease RseP [Candidatus Latescibacterota bacterium]